MALNAESERWLNLLSRRLNERQRGLKIYDEYYRGQHRLAFASNKFRQAFGYLFEALAVNFCLLVVDAERERLKVDGFRTGGANDTQADNEAWRIWHANQLTARSSIAHTEALIKGISYVSVWRNGDLPRIRVEDSLQTVVAYDLEDPDVRTAALKRWKVERGTHAVLFLPDRIEKYQTVGAGIAPAWEPRIVDGEPWPLPNPLEVVPIVPFVNNPLLDAEGRSELASVIPIQDMINKLVADMIVASEFAAFPQRWATGIETPVDDAGNPIETFKAGVDRFWGTDNPEAKFGQFAQASLEPYVKGVEMLVQDIASITHTPPHYLLGQSGQFPSGESLTATEAGLVAKVESQQRHFGESWKEVMALAFEVIGNETDTRVSEIRWAPAERRAPAQYADALGKQRTMLGIPEMMTWEKAGYSQTEIERMLMLKQQEAIAANVTDTVTPDQAEVIGSLIRAGFDAASVLSALSLPPMKHLGLPPVTLQSNPANLAAIEDVT